MKVALIAEIIVEHCFIGVGGCGDFIGAGAGEASLGKMILGRGEDAPCGFGVLDWFSSAWHLISLTNWLV
jgi:hypothetical protein